MNNVKTQTSLGKLSFLNSWQVDFLRHEVYMCHTHDSLIWVLYILEAGWLLWMAAAATFESHNNRKQLLSNAQTGSGSMVVCQSVSGLSEMVTVKCSPETHFFFHSCMASFAMLTAVVRVVRSPEERKWHWAAKAIWWVFKLRIFFVA